MSTAVFTSKGGHAFHADRDCPAFESGQAFWDTDDFSGYRARPTTIPVAMGAGKLPCGTCMPDLRTSWFRTPCEDDFGHEPVDEYADTPFRTHRVICARCISWGSWPNVGLRFGVAVSWPCTSAVVLGLALRPEDTLELTV